MSSTSEAARKVLGELPGLKEADLISMGACQLCGKQQLEGGDVTFYCVEITRAGFDRRAVERRVGFEMMLGSGPLAKVMGPDEDIAKVINGPHKVFVHESCAGKIFHLLDLTPETDKKATG